MRGNVLLLRYHFYPPLQVVCFQIVALHARHEQWRILEQVFHFFQRSSCSLRKNRPEKDGVCKVTDAKPVIVNQHRPLIKRVLRVFSLQVIPAIANVGHRNRRGLANHGIERE